MVKGKTKYQVIIDLPEYDELEASSFLCMLMTEHRILKERIKGKAIVHCFTGSINELYDYLDNNLFIGITGWVCDPKRGKNLESIIPEIPINKLLIETDSPYLLPKSLKVKNRRNEPSFLPVIFDKIANLRKEPREELKHQIYENSVNFFNLSE